MRKCAEVNLSDSETLADDRHELIDFYKTKLIQATNIEDSPEEMAVLNSMMFRMWQMGWLETLREAELFTDVWRQDCSTSLNLK